MSARLSLCAAVLLTLSAVILVTPVLADDSWQGGEGRSASAIALDQRIAAGDLKYLDSRTGEIVVASHGRIAMLRLELAPQFGRPAGASVTTAADGTVRANSNGALRDVYLVRTNLDGTRTRGCFRDLDSAIAFIVGIDDAQPSNTGDESLATAVE